MKSSFIWILLVLLFQPLLAEEQIPVKERLASMKSDPSTVLLEVDRAFNRRAQEVGVPAAFVEFAAEDAVMYRNGMDPIIGKEAIAKLLAPEGASILIWKPQTADIAESGDLGYTRGSFTLTTAPSADGTPGQGPFEGYYVSIWKKQPDGSWKWVFDNGIISKQP
jgi:ketosteroid isomerase-like protein